VDPYQGELAASFARTQLGASAVFVLADDADHYVRGLAESFEAAFVKAGGIVVGKEKYDPKQTDYRAILARVRAAQPDVVYLPDYYNIVNLVRTQALQMGVNIPFVGGDGWDSSDLDLTATEGCFFTNHYAPDDPSVAVAIFRMAYEAKFSDEIGRRKTPDALAALAYDATNLLLKAIDEAGVDDPAKVAEALLSIRYSGVSGAIEGFDLFHNPIKTGVVLAVRGGHVEFATRVGPVAAD
jgi:branched-chain amino acid transport system substrate-binding protein